MDDELKLETVIIRTPWPQNVEAYTTDGGDMPMPSPSGTPSDIELVARAREAVSEIRTSVETLTLSQRDEIERDPYLTPLFLMPFQSVHPNSADETEAIPPGGNASWGIGAIGAETLGESAGRDVIVAVLDTGIDAAHDAFRGVDLIRHNFTSDPDGDTDGHGTHCAGTIFGRDVGGVRIGVARGVERALIGKVLGAHGGSTQSVLDGIQWAMAMGANVISMSLGIDFIGFQDSLIRRGVNPRAAISIALRTYQETLRVFDSIGAVALNGGSVTRPALFVGASGNASNRPIYTIACEPPATANGFISVASIDAAGDVAWDSNTRPFISAPGVNIVSARRGGGLVAKSGTSMAAPHVAGLACVLMASNPGLSAENVRYLLRQNAKPLTGKPEDIGCGRASL